MGKSIVSFEQKTPLKTQTLMKKDMIKNSPQSRIAGNNSNARKRSATVNLKRKFFQK